MNKLYELLDFELSSYLESQKDYEYDIGVEGEAIRLSMRYGGSMESYPSVVVCDFLNEGDKNICIINGVRKTYFQGIIRNYVNTEIKNFETKNTVLEDTPTSEKADEDSSAKSKPDSSVKPKPDKDVSRPSSSGKTVKAPSLARPKEFDAPVRNLSIYSFLLLGSCLVLLIYLSVIFTVFLFDHFQFSKDLNGKVDSLKVNNSFSSAYNDLEVLISNNSKALAMIAKLSNDFNRLSLDVQKIKERKIEKPIIEERIEPIIEERIEPIIEEKTDETREGIFPPALVDNVKLNLRKRPNSRSLKLGEYKRGDKVIKVLGKDPSSHWLKVRLADGNEGWFFQKYLKLNISVSNVPVIH